MSKRKSNIYHRKDGRWEGRFHISGTKKYISVYGKSYGEAKEKLEKIYAENYKSKVKCNASFGETAEKWLESVKERIKESSFYCYSNKLYKHIIDLEKRKIYISKIVIRDSNIFSENPDEPKTMLVIRDYVYHKGKKIFTIPQKTAEILKEFEPENKDVFLLTNSCNFIEPRCYVNFEKRCFEECHIEIKNNRR